MYRLRRESRYEKALESIMVEYHYRNFDWVATDLMLPFRMKEIALKALSER